jgi:dihydroxyacetone kinase-like protein
MAVSKHDVLDWIAAIQQTYAENRQRLTDLDSAIGDADHGINMDRGFQAVRTQLAADVPADIRAVFQTTATVLIRTVGGASGPLYGAFFLRAADSCAGKSELGAADVVALFQAGILGVQQRGKASLGDKTMIDALVPALAAMQTSLTGAATLGEILKEGKEAAEAGMVGTVPMQARKGRASYLGPRSIGHQDPGATSACLLLRAAATTWRDK